MIFFHLIRFVQGSRPWSIGAGRSRFAAQGDRRFRTASFRARNPVKAAAPFAAILFQDGAVGDPLKQGGG
jgi:hypothetical protein